LHQRAALLQLIAAIVAARYGGTGGVGDASLDGFVIGAAGDDGHLLPLRRRERRTRRRSFSRQEWAFVAASAATFILYLFTREPNLVAALITLIDALGYGPTFVRGWSQPQKDSVASFAPNAVKFVPSLMAMDPITFATSFYPAALRVLNTGAPGDWQGVRRCKSSAMKE
jgi:hypothetical protein